VNAKEFCLLLYSIVLVYFVGERERTHRWINRVGRDRGLVN